MRHLDHLAQRVEKPSSQAGHQPGDQELVGRRLAEDVQADGRRLIMNIVQVRLQSPDFSGRQQLPRSQREVQIAVQMGRAGLPADRTADRLFGIRQQPGSAGGQIPSGIGKHQAPGRSIEQPRPEPLFQPNERFGDCWGGQPEVGRSGGDAAGFDHFGEDRHRLHIRQLRHKNPKGYVSIFSICFG